MRRLSMPHVVHGAMRLMWNAAHVECGACCSMRGTNNLVSEESISVGHVPLVAAAADR